jgi:hypothetical protein
MSKPNLHDRVARTGMAQRFEKLRTDSQRQWGKMSVDQMVWHINETLRMAIGELPVASKGYGPLKQAIFKFMVFNLPFPKEKGQASPELLATRNYDLDGELRRFPMLLEHVASKDIAGEWPVHPFIGPLTGEQWSRAMFIHMDHHLRQFSA